MKKINICVVGLGSMGRRRIKILKKEKNINIIGVDINFQRAEKEKKELGIKVYSTLKEAINNESINSVFVCTSPIHHGQIINESLQNDINVFSEINLIDDLYEKNIKLAKKKNLVLFLSSTFLYKKDINFIIDKIEHNKEKINYVYHVGQYLPDWHPWESYKDYFVNEIKTNGCREIMAIEFPWIISAFGAIKNKTVIKNRISKLKLKYNDNFMIQLNHVNGNKGMIEIDVVSRKAVRRLEVFGENIYLSWEGTPDSLMEYEVQKKRFKNVFKSTRYKHNKDYADFVVEDPYEEEVKTFLKLIKNKKCDVPWDFKKDQKVLKIIDEIEK